MLHTKFQSPSINIDRFLQLSAVKREKEMEFERAIVSKLVSEGTKMYSSAFTQRTKSELIIGLVTGGEYW